MGRHDEGVAGTGRGTEGVPGRGGGRTELKEAPMTFPHRPHIPHQQYVPPHHHHAPPPYRPWGGSSGWAGPVARGPLTAAGVLLQVLGLLVALTGAGLFLSNFFLGPSIGGGPDVHDPNFWVKAQARHAEFRREMEMVQYRALGGMALIFVGVVTLGVANT